MARTPTDYLVLDLETVPDDQRWQRPEGDQGGDQRPSPFPPLWAHRIVVVGCMWLDRGYGLRRMSVFGDPAATGSADERERALLTELSAFIGTERPVLVTFNGRSFDLPVIALRALCHGVPIGWYYRDAGTRSRYSEQGHLDLCDWLADHGATRSSSLDAIARLAGLPGKIGVDGSQVEGLYRAGQLAAIESYCLADVAQTALVFLRFRLIQGLITPAAYRELAGELVAAFRADPRLDPLMGGL
ncbi:MAG: ribonuclease H-like domain-containing protein, partial [Polyangiales bacterium]